MAFDKPKTCVVLIWNCNTLSFFNIGFFPTRMFGIQNILGPLSQKTYEPGKFMIVGKTPYDWPTLLTMARGG